MGRMTPLSYLTTKAGNWLQSLKFCFINFLLSLYVLHQEIVKQLNNNNLIKHIITIIFFVRKSHDYFYFLKCLISAVLESLII